jgi:Mrp family chromosome partitioning ATPase/capsular polysaccharide biosynthesis protein
VLVLTVAVAAVISLRTKPTYRASTSLVVRQLNPGVGGDFGTEPLLQTMTNLLQSDVVVRGAIRDFGLKMTPEQFLTHLHVTHKPDSSVLEVSFDSANRDAAVPILERVAKDYQDLVKQKLGPGTGDTANSKLPNGTETGLPVVSATEWNSPHLNPTALSSKRARTLVVAGVLGLAVGLLLAFLREGLDERVRSRSDAEEWFEAPVVGTLPKIGRSRGKVGFERSELTGAIEVLRANFLFSQSGGGGPAVLITSAMPGEGKTLVSAHLALALGMAGENTIVVDADLRRPSLHRSLGLDGEALGLFDVLADGIDVEDALKEIELPVSGKVANRSWPSREGLPASGVAAAEEGGRLRVLTAGTSGSRTRSDPAGILTRERVDDVIQRLRAEAEFVVIDGPPLLVADAFPFAIESDRVLIVARQGRTSRDKAQAARATLAGLGVERVAVVLTDAASANDYRYE